MATTRKRLNFPVKLEKAIEELGERWGLDFNSTVTHCCALIVEQERERREKAAPKVPSSQARPVTRAH